MVLPRRVLVQEGVPGCYHLMSRCGRQLFLFGGKYAERRRWVERELRRCAESMAVEVLTFAVMSNHMHVVMRIRPDLAVGWSEREIVDRWLELVPRRGDYGERLETDDVLREILSADEAWVEERRRRLSSMSWFMRLVKQRIAHRANRQDDVRGHFWDGRFKSVPLVDQAAILACMVYVDLNPVRAGMCAVPENGGVTGYVVRCARKIRRENGEEIDCSESWMPELARCGIYRPAFEQGNTIDKYEWEYEPPSCTDEEYLLLVDQTGRQVQNRGLRVPLESVSVLERLGMRSERWVPTMSKPRQMRGILVGAIADRRAAAARLGQHWVSCFTMLFDERVGAELPEG